jgi:hypothetical protein
MVNPKGYNLADYTYRITYKEPIMKRRQAEIDELRAETGLTYSERNERFTAILNKYSKELRELLPILSALNTEAYNQIVEAARLRVEEENRVSTGLRRLDSIDVELERLHRSEMLRRRIDQDYNDLTHNQRQDRGLLPAVRTSAERSITDRHRHVVLLEDEMLEEREIRRLEREAHMRSLYTDAENIRASITNNERHDHGASPALPTVEEWNRIDRIHGSARRRRRRRKSHRKKNKSRRAPGRRQLHVE